MKYFITMIFTGVITMLITQASAQKFSNDTPITIENLAPENVWQIVEMTLKEKGFGLGKFLPEENKLSSNWIEWTSVAIKNRGRLIFTYEKPNLTFQMADRGYETKKGFEESIGNLSKKNYAEYLQSVADRITEINGNEAETKKAILSSELFPAFNPINKVNELVLTLKKSTEIDLHSTLEFSVHNTASYVVNVDIPIVNFYASISGGANSYGGSKWSRPDDMRRKATFQPGETLTLSVEYGSIWKTPILPRLEIKIICKSASGEKTQILKIYQIPLKDYVFNPEEQ